MKKKNIRRLFLAMWMVLLILLGIYFALFAPRNSEYSQEENRTLAGFPALTAENIFSGNFSQQMEDYLLDHFPGRNSVIDLTNWLQSSLSFASYDEYLLVAEGPKDLLDTGIDQDEIDDLLNDFQSETASPTAESTQPPTETTEETTTPPEETTAPAETTVPPTEKPLTIDDFPNTLYVRMDTGDGEKMIDDYSRSRVAAVTAVLNKYAQLLPEGGKLTFTVVPQSRYANRFVNAKEKVSFYATWDDVVNGLGNHNVYAFDTAEILADAIRRGEYVYFRTDMHWTPYGSYLVYSQMVQQAGKTPCSYTEDFNLTVEEPFRGTYYRDNPSAYMNVEADTLDLLMPKFPLEWRRTTGKDEYKLIDFLNFDAKKNDRYTVYLGGPAGPWTYAECDNGETESCLVITDSFGLGYIPFLTCNYKQVHYYDTRYYNAKTVGYSVSEMIDLYDIQDIYVVVGDLHSFESSFILTNANEQLK